MGQHSITAIIYNKRGAIVSVGQNSYTRTHPLQAKLARETGNPHKVFLHAEVAALVKLKDWRQAHKMVITRFTKDGQPANAAPCPSCLKAIKLANISYVEHT